jgi:Spy/CpxP family protein refolding chaperone
MKIRTALVLALLSLPLTPVAVMADPQQDQDACMMDAQIVCGQFIPDRERVAACLMSNRSRISPACREALKHFK